MSIPIILAGIGWSGLAVYEVIAMPETGFQREANPEHEGMARCSKLSAMAAGWSSQRGAGAVHRAGVFTGASSEGMDRLSEAHFLKNFAFPEMGAAAAVVWFGMIDLVLLLVGLGVTEELPQAHRHEQPHTRGEGGDSVECVADSGIVGFALAGGFWWAAAAYVAMRLFRGVASPLFNTWITQSIDQRVRATVLSMVSQSDAIGQVAGGPVIGWIGTAISLRAALVTSAVLLMPAIPLVAAARRRVLVEPAGAESGLEIVPATTES